MIADNGGVPSLEKMYAGIGNYRDLSGNRAWQGTLRGILYQRVLPEGRVRQVGLGLYGLAALLPAVAPTATAFEQAAQERSPRTGMSTRHADTQGMLLELGSYYKFDTYTADPSVTFDGKPLGSIATLAQLPPFTYDSLVAKFGGIDVIWMSRETAHSCLVRAFEVENTPEFNRSLLKLYHLRSFRTELVLIGDYSKEDLFRAKLGSDPFHNVRDLFEFRTFDTVVDLYQKAVQTFVAEEQFFRPAS